MALAGPQVRRASAPCPHPFTRSMKRLCSVLALLVVTPVVARAQVGFGLAAGAVVPNGSLGNAYDAGYHLQASVRLGLPLAPLGFRIDGTYDNFARKSSTGSSGSWQTTGAAVNAVASLPALPGLYGTGGLGYYWSKSEVTSGVFSGSGTAKDVGYNIGAGFHFALTGFGAFVEARYTHIGGGSAVNFI